MEAHQPEPNPEPSEAPEHEPRDILAAEAFAVGAGDPGLHHEPARDVLAAEEFPLPAPEQHSVPPDWQAPDPASAASAETAVVPRSSRVRRLVPVVILAGVAVLVLKRRRRRR